MITLRPITKDNFDVVIDLDVHPKQHHFVAPNTYSLAEAYLHIVNHYTIPMPFAINADETVVGFLMLSYDEKDPDDPKDETVYWIWRFMIDKAHQGRGYGKAAMEKTLAYIRTFPKGPATAIVLSYEPENTVVQKLYARLGFIETGEVDEGELIAKLVL